MDVGIGLPSTIPGAGRDQLLEWARRAEARGFSTLGTIDRIVYPSHDPLIALAAAAGGDRADPPRDHDPARAHPGQRRGARQAGRHARRAVGRAPRARRGRRAPRGRLRGRRRRLPRARADPRRDARPLGPDLGRRGLRRGRGDRPAAGRRAAVRDPRRLGGRRLRAAPRATATAGPAATARWRSSPTGPRACGPRGRPPDATARRGRWCSRTTRSATARSRRSSAACATTTGPGTTRTTIVARAATDAETVRENVRAFAEAGCDELIFFPCDPDPDQVDLLADALAVTEFATLPEPARPGGVRQRRCDRARRRVRRPARRAGRAGRLRRHAGRRGARARRERSAGCYQHCDVRDVAGAAGGDRRHRRAARDR